VPYSQNNHAAYSQDNNLAYQQEFSQDYNSAHYQQGYNQMQGISNAARPTLTTGDLAEFSQNYFYQELDEQIIPDLETRRLNAVDLMQISSIIQAVHLPQGQGDGAVGATAWDESIKQLTGSVRAITTSHRVVGAAISGTFQQGVAETPAPQSGLKALFGKPIVKIILGGAVGIAMIYLVSKMVDIPTTMEVLRKNLTTMEGIINILLACFFFMAAFSIRGVRWSMFLRRITRVKTLKVIQIFWIGVFTNVLLPIQGGELAKSLMLKRVAGTPVSQSLPTVAMDRALDLMPALVIMAVVAFIPGVQMSLTLWGILALVSSILIGVIFVVALTAWNRKAATALIQFMIRLLPRKIGSKIEGFAMGFVDSLLAGASQPKTFIPAVLLTCVAVCCDGLFAMFSFWTVGLYQNMHFGTAIFGYTLFNMFTILPTPPGQVGSNELIGTIVFGDLLGFDKKGVLAMFVLTHPLTAFMMAMMAMISLSMLGLKLSSLWKTSVDEKPMSVPAETQREPERQVAAV
jgi:uncharacterized protein (TIRG00374 family)